MCGNLKRIILALLLVSWMALIFALSAETASESKSTSAGFTFRVFSIFYPDFDEKAPEEQQRIIEDFSFLVRKSAHFAIYCVLGILAASNTLLYDRLSIRAKPVVSQIFCVLYSVSDEIHQIFIDGRAGQIRDVFIDSVGALLGIIFVYLLYVNRERIKKIFTVKPKRRGRNAAKKGA